MLEHPSPRGEAVPMCCYLRSVIPWAIAVVLLSATTAFAAPNDHVAVDDSLTGRCRCWLRTKMVRDTDLSNYGLVLDDQWQQADAARPVVIVVHGYNSRPERNK